MNIFNESLYDGVEILFYRRGKNVVTTSHRKSKLEYITPATSTYQPLTHKTVIDMVAEALIKQGQKLETIRLSFGGGRKSGMVARLLTTCDVNGAQKMWVVVHGHDRRSSIKVASGFEVEVCTNGCIFATEIISGRHTKNVIKTFTKKLNEFIEKEIETEGEQTILMDRFKEKELDFGFVSEFLVKAALEGTITQIIRVAQSFIDAEDYTVWGLWQAITLHNEICSEAAVNRADEQIKLLKCLL